MWEIEELQRLQALFYILKDAEFDEIYKKTNDNRRMRDHILKVNLSLNSDP